MKSSRNYQGKKYNSIYRGIVSKVNDPENRGRVCLLVPSIFKNSQETLWALPCFPEFSATSPDIGTPAWVMFEDGNINKPVWLGTWHTTSALLNNFTEDKEDIVYSREGGTIKINNSKGELFIFNRSGKIVYLSKTEIHINDGEGNIIVINSPSNTIELKQADSNKITLNESGVSVTGSLKVNGIDVALVTQLHSH